MHSKSHSVAWWQRRWWDAGFVHTCICYERTPFTHTKPCLVFRTLKYYREPCSYLALPYGLVVGCFLCQSPQLEAQHKAACQHSMHRKADSAHGSGSCSLVTATAAVVTERERERAILFQKYCVLVKLLPVGLVSVDLQLLVLYPLLLLSNDIHGPWIIIEGHHQH